LMMMQWDQCPAVPVWGKMTELANEC